MKRIGALWFVLAAGGCCCAQDQVARPQGVPTGFELLYSQSFDNEASIEDMVFSDPNAWRYVRGQDGNGYLEQFQASQYEYKVRSPLNIGLIAALQVESFVLEADLMQTGRDYGHRDMCAFFGFQDPSHFYYSHIATATDPHAHNIFIVNDQPRTKISTTTTQGHDWGQNEWRRVRIVRDAASGKIEVYVQDMSEPIMTASDRTFGWGHVGFGTFDDTGRIDNIRVWAPRSRTGRPEFFKDK